MKAIDYFLKKEYREDKKNPERIFFQDLLFYCFAVRTGLEPVTPCVTGMYSNQLN